MRGFLVTLCFFAIGLILAISGITYLTWQYWAIMGLAFTAVAITVTRS